MIIIMINEVILGSTFNFTDFDTKCSPCKNSRLPWIPWIRDFRLALIMIT